MLTLGKNKFELDNSSDENRLYLCSDEKGNMAWNLELHYSAGEYGGETVQPTLIIYYIKNKEAHPRRTARRKLQGWFN